MDEGPHMERDLSKISLITDWSYLIALETGLFTRGELSGAVLKALNDQARLLSRRYLVQKSKLDVRRLTPAETEILDTLSETAANLRRRQRLPHNIVKSLRAGGLIKSVRGPGGGYVLARPSTDITIAVIYRAVFDAADVAAEVQAA